MDIVIAIIAGLVGVVVGGVINVLADDLPHRRGPQMPHYPDGTPRSRLAWLGLLAFVTGQRESSLEPGSGDAVDIEPENPVPEPVSDLDDLPQEPPPSRFLSWRHPLIEIITGLTFGAMVLAFRDEAHLVVWLVYVAILYLVTVIDVEHRLILFAVILPACAFTLIVGAVMPEGDRTFMNYVYGGLIGFALFFAMFLGGGAFSIMARHNEVAFGFGDVMLATLSGMMIGWEAFIFASLITVFAGAVGAVLYLAGRMLIRRRYRWFTPLPYGPYIVIGTLVMLLFREEVQDLLRDGLL
ncbi:MAG: prepilin peptidase [Anaerolineae bacterium]|nr:prepilin peptidase [Anaerolineae bacterium]